MNRAETARRLSLYYSERFSGKVSSYFDESKRAYYIQGSGLPSHSSCPYPTWEMSDNIAPSKARELVAGKTDEELREAARVKAAQVKAEADAIVEGPDHPWRKAREARQFSVDYDGAGLAETFTLGELFSDPDADNFLTRAEVEAMAVDQSINFGGGAAPLGTITRIQ